MERRSIVELPKICELILQHLDAEERQEAVLVSREFYFTVCRLKQTLLLNEKKVN